MFSVLGGQGERKGGVEVKEKGGKFVLKHHCWRGGRKEREISTHKSHKKKRASMS